MYQCEICKYSTDDKSNLRHHNKSNKHLSNLEKSNLEKDNEILKLKDKEIEELKQKLADSENQKKEFEIKAQVYKELAEKSKNINQGIIINNNLNYVNKHFKNAPPLKKISNYNINGIDLEDDNQIDKLTEKIIYSYNNKCLHKLIGDHIVANYKKDDLKLQSFHATDVARRKFLVKLEDSMGYLYDESSDEIDYYDPENESELSESNDSEDDEYDELKKEYEDEQNNNNKVMIKKKKSKWTNDNEGVKISYLLFEPLIRKIIRQLKKKCREHNKAMSQNKKKIPTKEEAQRFEVLSSILKEIDKDKLKKNINNYIAPYFGLAK